MHVRLKNSVST